MDLKNDCLLLNLKYFSFQYLGAFLRINPQQISPQDPHLKFLKERKKENDGMHF